MPNRSMKEIIQAIQKREISPQAIIETSLKLVEKLNPELHIFISVNSEGAKKAAHSAEERIKKGEKNPFLGIPVCIPDVINFPPFPTTFGSKLFLDNIPAECTPELQKMQNMGFIVIGKTNLSEFGLDPETQNALQPPTRNPLNTQLSSGGPNGGTAAAVAAGICPIGLATDFCGSIRISASFCQQVGFIPTHGLMPVRVAHYMPLTERRLLRKGFIGRKVDDIEMLFLLLTSKEAEKIDRPLRIAYSPDLGFLNVDAAVTERFMQTIDQLQCAGHTLELVQLGLDASTLVHYQNIIAVDRALIIKSALEKKPDGFDLLTPLTKEWLHYAESVTGIDYAYAETYLSLIKDKIDAHINGCDILITPTSPVFPYPVNQLPALIKNSLVDAWSFTLPFNMSGQPVLALPNLQIISKSNTDAHLLAAAKIVAAAVA